MLSSDHVNEANLVVWNDDDDYDEDCDEWKQKTIPYGMVLEQPN